MDDLGRFCSGAVRIEVRKLLFVILMGIGLCGGAGAQDSGGTLPDAPQPKAPQQQDEVTIKSRPMAILKDQGRIWTSPLRLRAHDLVWLAPLAGATGAAFATDQHVMNSIVSKDPTFNDASIYASDVLVGGFVAAPVALYAVGRRRDDPRAREAGVLGGEAVVDGLVVQQGLKLIFWQERPALHHASGFFFRSRAGWDSSFPSSHSVVSWSSAAVLAAEYPSRWAQVGFYSAASGVALTRVLGQQHFPSDVLVGSAVGWLVGHYVFRAHHRHFLDRL